MKTFTKDDVKVNQRERAYNGFFKIDRLDFDHKRFDGDYNRNVIREIVIRDDAVAVLPYDPVNDLILLIEQIRIPLLDNAESPWLYEIIAGMIDTDESKEEVARREVKEEAGISIEQLVPIQSYFSSPGGGSEKIYLYLGLCNLSDAGGFYGLESESEDIRAFTIKREEAFSLLDQGLLENAPIVIALMWFKSNYKKYCKQV